MAVTAATPRGEKHSAFYACLHERILSGNWKPGQRIPNRSELAREFNTTLATIQKALHRLRNDGFVIPRGRSGTFVASVLPGDHCFAIGFPGRREPGKFWSRFWGAIEAVGKSLSVEGHTRIIPYYGLEDSAGEGMQRLVRDLEHSTLIGALLVAVPPAVVASQPALSRYAGRIFSMHSSDPPIEGIVPIHMEPLVGKVLDHLQLQGRRRIGLVNSAHRASDPALFRQELARRNLTFDAYRIVSASPLDSELVRVAVFHMMKQPPNHRPDALFITDDHMTEAVSKALIDAGCRVPQDVTVVTLANFPCPPSSPSAMTLVGCDLSAVLTRAVAAARAARYPQPTPPKPIEVPIVWHTHPAAKRLSP